MPITIAPNKLYAKKQDGSGYLPANVVTGETTEEQCAAVEAKGTTEVARIQTKAEEVTAQLANAAEVENMFAGAFNSSTAYTAGQYVIQTITSGGSSVNKLFRFTSDHAAGAWTGTDAVEVKICNDVADLKSAMNVISDQPSYTWTIGKRIGDDGNAYNASYSAITQNIPVSIGDVFFRKTPSKTSGNVNMTMRVAQYYGTTFVRTDSVAANASYQIPSGVNNIIIAFAHPSAAGVAMTQETINTYFDVELYTSAEKKRDFENFKSELNETALLNRGDVITYLTAKGATFYLSNCTETGFYTFIKPDAENILDLPNDYGMTGGTLITFFRSESNKWQLLFNGSKMYYRFPLDNIWRSGYQEIPEYWETEISTSVDSIRSNIMSAQTNSITMLIVTDCHWARNVKISPSIAKDICDKTNINYFVNLGDYLYGTNRVKKEAVDEISDCINSFKMCGKPMITLYGNHDRNYSSDPEDAKMLNPQEVGNLIFKNFLPNNGYTVYSGDLSPFECVTFEDDYYKYVMVYWYNSVVNPDYSPAWVEDACSTDNPDKKIVVLTHGIYIDIKTDETQDDLDSPWILNAFEPYKNKIEAFITGHAHKDGLRRAYEGVPIIILDQDTINKDSTKGTITEQSLSALTIEHNKISVVKIGRGSDFVITPSTADFTGTNTYDEEH